MDEQETFKRLVYKLLRDHNMGKVKSLPSGKWMLRGDEVGPYLTCYDNGGMTRPDDIKSSGYQDLFVKINNLPVSL